MTEQEVRKYIDAMNQVKPINYVPGFNGVTVPMAREYFSVPAATLQMAMTNSSEIRNNRIRVGRHEFEHAGYSISVGGTRNNALTCTNGEFTLTTYPNGWIYILNEHALACLAERFQKSEVAQRVRGIIMNDTFSASANNTSLIKITDVQTFMSDKFGGVRTILRDGQLWFVAVDICKVLNIGNATNAVKRLEADETEVISIKGISRSNDKLIIVNESGLYALTLSSRRPEATAFKHWITHEVIPAIRKQGAYITPKVADDILMNPDFLIQLAERRKQEIAQMDKLRASLEQITTEAAQYKDELQRANDSVKELTATNAALSEAVDRNQATTEELNRAVADLTAAKSENDSLTEKLAATKQSKKKLEDKVNAYECRDMILALIRAYSYAACGGLKQEANDDFQRELFARHGIDLEPRIKYFGAGRSVIDYLRTDEYDKAANMMISMCKQRGINTAKILNVSRPGELFERKTA